MIENLLDHFRKIWGKRQLVLYIIFCLIVLVALWVILLDVSMPSGFIDYLLLVAAFIILLPVFFLFSNELKKENIWHAHSWCYYVIRLLVFTPILYFIYKLCKLGWHSISAYSIFIFAAPVWLITFIFYKNIRIEFGDKWIFAPDSVGKNGDKFNFKSSSERIANRIINDDSSLKVYLLDGSQGYGKSSYARMIVESLGNPKDVLYTYVSLTETNEENDLSKLFEERWEITLAERYPRICSGCFDGIAEIIRIPETRFSLKDLFIIFKYIDFPINKTKVIENKSESSAVKYCSEKNARLFRCVSKIHEKVWAIVFDEVDRALPREIYRLVEIVERFKYLEAGEFPVKLRFFICVSRERLDGIFEDVKETNDKPLGGFIKDFFDLKNQDTIISLPLVSFKKRWQFVRGLLKNIYKNGHELSVYKNTMIFSGISNTVANLLTSEQSLQVAIKLLCEESPRVAKKCINSASFWNGVFFKKGAVGYIYIRFSDLVLMEYIRTRYKFLWNFMEKTIEQILPEENEDKKLFDMNDYKTRLRIEETTAAAFGTSKQTLSPQQKLAGWIREYYPGIEEKLLDRAIQIFTAAAFCYIQYFDTSPRAVVGNSLGNGWNLYRYLSLSGDYYEFDKLEMWYLEHKNKEIGGGGVFAKVKSSKDLIRYALNICQIKDVPPRVLLDTAKELWSRLRSKRIKFSKYNYHDNSFRVTSIARIPPLLYLILRDEKKPIAESNEAEEAIKLFIDILRSQDVEIELKLSLLEYIKSYEVIGRPYGPEMHILFYKNLLNTEYGNEVKTAYSYVFDDFKKRYLDNKNNNIYELEGNALYVLYNIWSGEKNGQEINRIHEIAERFLDKDKETILKLWSCLKDPQELSVDIKDVIKPNSFNIFLFVDLDKLIEATDVAIKKGNPAFSEKVEKYRSLSLTGRLKVETLIIPKEDTLRSFINSLLKKRNQSDDGYEQRN
ncbi:MAG: DMT family transporter [Candidatus Omnitrophica bacterium]|nr:DMT family transporter [Candidatus Omnitrophota bacterium]